MTKDEHSAMAAVLDAAHGLVDEETREIVSAFLDRERDYTYSVAEFYGGPRDGLRLVAGVEMFRVGYVYSLDGDSTHYAAAGISKDGTLMLFVHSENP